MTSPESRLLVPRWLAPAPARQNPPRPDRWRRFTRTGDRSFLLPSESVWEILQWVADSDELLLHGSQTGALTELQPRTPEDRSPDSFSKEHAVFGSSDAIWALCYALRGREADGMLNSCVHLETDTGWSQPHYFLSLSGPRPGPGLLEPGWIHLVAKRDFERMAPYEWPGVGRVLEAQWSSQCPVPVVASVRVETRDLPLRPRSHSREAIQRASSVDPHGFPWLTHPAE